MVRINFDFIPDEGKTSFKSLMDRLYSIIYLDDVTIVDYVDQSPSGWPNVTLELDMADAKDVLHEYLGVDPEDYDTYIVK